MDVALISDSHIPSRANEIPRRFAEHIEAADHVIHAGDFDSRPAFDTIDEMASGITAVEGNTDPFLGLPSLTSITLEGIEFVVTHGTGSRAQYEARVADRVATEAHSDDAIGVAGHTHEPMDTTHGGTRILNPGTVTGAPPTERATMYTATVDNGDLEVQLHE